MQNYFCRNEALHRSSFLSQRLNVLRRAKDETQTKNKKYPNCFKQLGFYFENLVKIENCKIGNLKISPENSGEIFVVYLLNLSSLFAFQQSRQKIGLSGAGSNGSSVISLPHSLHFQLP